MTLFFSEEAIELLTYTGLFFFFAVPYTNGSSRYYGARRDLITRR